MPWSSKVRSHCGSRLLHQGLHPQHTMSSSMERQAPESSAGFLSKVLFLWVIPFAAEAWRAVKEKRFSAAVLPPIPKDEAPEHNFARLREAWVAEIASRGSKASLARVCLKMVSRTLLTCLLIMNFQALLTMSCALISALLIQAMQGLQPPEIGFLSLLCCSWGRHELPRSLCLQPGSWLVFQCKGMGRDWIRLVRSGLRRVPTVFMVVVPGGWAV